MDNVCFDLHYQYWTRPESSSHYAFVEVYHVTRPSWFTSTTAFEALTLFTIRLLFPLNTSPASTHRFHAHSAPCSTKYPTTPIHRAGFDSSNDKCHEYRQEPRARMTEVYPNERWTVGCRMEGVKD